MAATIKSKFISKLLRILEKRYGKKPRPPSWDLVETLLFYTLYHGTGITAARRALKAFREEYVDFNEIRVSNLAEIRTTLRHANANEDVASDLRGVLKQIYGRENEISLDTLESFDPDQIRRYFTRLNHIPSHAVDYLLMVKWNHNVVPVDKQIARMCTRIGLVPSKAKIAQVQKIITRNTKSNACFDFFTLFLEHSSKVCTKDPKCDRCVLIKQCKYGQSASRKKSGK